MNSCSREISRSRYLGAEQVSANDDDADCYHEVRIEAGVALIDDTAK